MGASNVMMLKGGFCKQMCVSLRIYRYGNLHSTSGEACNWFVVTEYTREKSASSGKSGRVFTDWLQKGGKKRILKRISVNKHHCQRIPRAMSVVAVIEDPQELEKIIEWARQQEREPLRTTSTQTYRSPTIPGRFKQPPADHYCTGLCPHPKSGKKTALIACSLYATEKSG